MANGYVASDANSVPQTKFPRYCKYPQAVCALQRQLPWCSVPAVDGHGGPVKEMVQFEVAGEERSDAGHPAVGRPGP